LAAVLQVRVVAASVDQSGGFGLRLKEDQSALSNSSVALEV